MSQENLVLHNMSEVVAAVPHFLGVHPQDSLVVVPEVTGGAPVARVNLPRGVTQTLAVAEGLARAYAGAGVGVVLLAYTDQPDLAREVCDTVRERLEPKVPVIGAVAVDGDDWVRLDGPHHGQVTQSDRDLMTAEFLLLERPTPFATPAQLRQAYAPGRAVPDQLMVLAAERAAAAACGGRLGEAEREWISRTLDRGAASHTVLPDADAARLIADVQHTPLRDHAWASMERSTPPRHAELWRDLLTRCPESPADATSPESTAVPVPPVAAVASLTAFAHWLDGDAVKARVALDRVPAGTAYPMARLIDVALELGMDPWTWTVPDDLDGPQHDPSASSKSVGLRRAIHEPPKPPAGRGPGGPHR
ncbi:DUF4192 domain-containing protein [Humibacillus xanthopallidus]|uniref:Uncharacterized protein DUF4192 n=1 Tax=Humibacillus xanthopallidus TaxID=412689 RepID=A0A543HZP6_9MICO|nr:DUF4192 domain-containing protein [Humibacillus xanthopallidus]TQM63788.1 uncharacterized protein DUF4192 [Humibacillus xanthopallidus]